LILIVKKKKGYVRFWKKTCFCKKKPESFLLSNYFSMHLTLEHFFKNGVFRAVWSGFQNPRFLNPMHKIIYLIVKIKKDTSENKKKRRFYKKRPFYFSMHLCIETYASQPSKLSPLFLQKGQNKSKSDVSFLIFTIKYFFLCIGFKKWRFWKSPKKGRFFFFKTFFSENFHFLPFNFSMHFTLELTLGFCSKIKPILLLFLKQKVFFKKNPAFFWSFSKTPFFKSYA